MSKTTFDKMHNMYIKTLDLDEILNKQPKHKRTAEIAEHFKLRVYDDTLPPYDTLTEYLKTTDILFNKKLIDELMQLLTKLDNILKGLIQIHFQHVKIYSNINLTLTIDLQTYRT